MERKRETTNKERNETRTNGRRERLGVKSKRGRVGLGMDQERNRGRGECAREGIGGASGNEIRSNRLLRMQFVGWAAGITDQRVVCFQGVDGICSRIGERDVTYACTVVVVLLTGFRLLHGAKRRLGPNSELIRTVRQKR
ncbi:hypothetical protein OPV22_006136 [Ensete ventricosum]|uniref:Uncharacterized protein n=1 Tax=Ensete ventricosum TaxID=4639 RepID=A0AAV8RQM3_ENSVE|nr:hypothetical protein OPV22_006136 [Ensete ventricosum]